MGSTKLENWKVSPSEENVIVKEVGYEKEGQENSFEIPGEGEKQPRYKIYEVVCTGLNVDSLRKKEKVIFPTSAVEEFDLPNGETVKFIKADRMVATIKKVEP